MIEFSLPDSTERVVLEEEVLQRFREFRQLKQSDHKAGGQLFARLDPPHIIVTMATGPSPRAKRRRFSFLADRAGEQLEINTMYEKGLHYVGDWHTHSSPRAQPSDQDFTSIADAVRRSRHNLGGFLLVVVGTSDPPAGLAVYPHDGRTAHQLVALAQDPSFPEHPQENKVKDDLS